MLRDSTRTAARRTHGAGVDGVPACHLVGGGMKAARRLDSGAAATYNRPSWVVLDFGTRRHNLNLNGIDRTPWNGTPWNGTPWNGKEQPGVVRLQQARLELTL
jgi:hypothetical protein